MRVFYSWQSDLPNATNRGLIETALERAAKAIRDDDSMQVEPVIDRDTADVPGAPDIAATIFEKIRTAAAFVCDVSIINGTRRQVRRPTPNPNVLVELGYAVGTLGWERVVLVANTAFGRIEDLPFDLRQRRALPYRSAENDTERAPERGKLQSLFESRLREILARVETTAQPAAAELAIAAVESGAKNADAMVRAYAGELCRKVHALCPKQVGAVAPAEQLIQSLEGTLDVIVEFARVCRALAAHQAEEQAIVLMRGLGPVLSGYDFRPRSPASNYQTSYDFHRFLGHELFVTLIAALLREERFSTIGRVFNQTVYVDGENGRENVGFQNFDHGVDLMRALSKERQRPSVHADILKERHETALLGEICSFTEFMDADYLAFLRNELPPAESPFDAFGQPLWRPWSSIYLARQVPAFVVQAKRRAYAERLLPAIGLDDVQTFRTRFAQRGAKFGNLWRNSFADFRHLTKVEIGSE